MLTHARIQYSAGQGCFHAASVGVSGTIGLDKSGLIYVYDCGALSPFKSRLSDAIARFHREIRHRNIDVLFISHLHLDHVSGIEELCGPSGVGVDTVVLPLFDDFDRIISFARAVSQDAAGITDFIVGITIDPLATVAATLQPRRIVVVRRGEGGAPDRGEVDVAPEGPDEDGRGFRTVSWGWSGGGTLGADGAPNSLPGSGTQVVSIDDTSGIEVQGRRRADRWLLAPYVDQEVSDQRQEFLAELARRLFITVSQLEELVADPIGLTVLLDASRDELAAAYSAVKNLNVTSLSLLSVPSDSALTGRWRLLPTPPAWRFFSFTPADRRIGWLGTGDAALKQAARRRRLLDHYAARLQQVSTFLLPHHGSTHNFHEELLDRIEPRLCIAAAAPFSNWKHPGTSVIQAANSRGCPLWSVTGDRRSEIRENVWTRD